MSLTFGAHTLKVTVDHLHGMVDWYVSPITTIKVDTPVSTSLIAGGIIPKPS